jgi:hypothetical protein
MYSILYEALAVARASYQGGLLPPPLDFDILSLVIALFRRYLQQAVHPERVLENAFASFGPSAWIIYSQTGNPLAWERYLENVLSSNA